jgi:hypothetical protein
MQLTLRGSADATEGMSLDELRLVVGQAQLSAKGLLGGQQQDASFSLTDFPAVLLQPLFSALPALQHAAPALDVRSSPSGGPPPPSSSSSVLSAQASAALSGLSSRLEASLASLGLRLPAGMKGAAGGIEGGDPLEPFLGKCCWAIFAVGFETILTRTGVHSCRRLWWWLLDKCR